MNKNKFLIGLFILATLAFVSCGKKKKDENKNDNKPPYEMIPLTLTKQQSVISVLGSVSHYNKAEITSKVLGRIEKVYKEEGNRVAKGQPLAKVETLNLEIQLKKDVASLEVQNKQIELTRAKYIQSKQRVERELANIEKARADLKDSKATYDNLNRTYENKKELFKIGAVSETELKGIETGIVSAQTNYFKAQKNLDTLQVGYRPEDLKRAGFKVPTDKVKLHEALVDLNTIVEKSELDIAIANLKSIQASIDSTNLLIRESTILSPLKGIVAVRSIFPGEAVKEGQAIYVVVDDSEFLLKFAVNESDLNRIKPDQEVEFVVDALPKKKLIGKILIISPIIDPQSRTAEVKVIYKNNEELLRPGMFARAEIKDLNPEPAFFIPAKSILPGKEKNEGFIFVSKNNLLFKKPVKIESVSGENSRITGDLNEGELVAIGNVAGLKEGEKAPEPILKKETTPK
ncbi:efflux RND transporter periplasmic adaptor subunit [Leptospira kmetyi]|uniref:Efflux RND transporter periplasmic adaptor subunit n=1 Tax=Leptospira kmetyi TaxID=408139 RepID=A0A2M9XS82_9LEPT|nr:efflux RND transporter periplasmic adaptor subunit [Leptospira kmetyi]AYV56422.1 efflux RND transporter periplasmic adaptor subunit [Leptospira kmetyi]EQA55280.1 HlyD family secretion protein [Leptospira kmetyi serovar Malaysia str. Bejo-Iso9]PJZ28931.1 efflux RND transporter periplasmic adaptor subunit [Leptospira kmetyi]PJZ42182.1 efflux RND transporter periplasmic adaptor subunit [Leptospira kmetyi]TGK10727.1 efflux RND transporter periplasmic adaptor subunit [Leptospira kmetyi]